MLLFERELQKLEPGIALPYWKMDKVPTIFTPDFIGTNQVVLGDEGFFVEVPVTFREGHALANWRIDLPDPFQQNRPLGPLMRNAVDHTQAPAIPDTEPFNTEERLLRAPDYSRFWFTFEGNPHDSGHGWVGAWMGRCQFSPGDPVFWMFHCELDRLWAKWQRKHNKFDTSGADPSHYFPTGSFDPQNIVTNPINGRQTPLGHHLKDTFWPWDGSAGLQFPGVELSRRPEPNTYGPFPASTIAGLWPAADARPQVADMIDYLNIAGDRQPRGFCYDDAEFGSEPPRPEPLANLREVAENARVTASKNLKRANAPVEEKLSALRILASTANAEAREAISAAAQDRTAPARLQSHALSLAARHRLPGAAGIAERQLFENKDRNIRRVALIGLVHLMHFGDELQPERKAVEASVAKALDDSDPAIQRTALLALVPMGDEMAIARLERLLNDKNARSPLLPLVQAIRLAAQVKTEPVLQALQNYLTDKRADVAAAAAWALTGDKTSDGKGLALLRDRRTPHAVREATLDSLIRDTTDIASVALELARNPAEPARLRAKAVTAFRVAVKENAGLLSREAFAEALNELQAIGASTSDSALRDSIAANLEWLK